MRDAHIRLLSPSLVAKVREIRSSRETLMGTQIRQEGVIIRVCLLLSVRVDNGSLEVTEVPEFVHLISDTLPLSCDACISSGVVS